MGLVKVSYLSGTDCLQGKPLHRSLSYSRIHRHGILLLRRQLAHWIGALFLASMVGCLGTPEEPAPRNPDTQQPLMVNVWRAEPAGLVFQSAVYYGTVKPKRASMLGFTRGGRLHQVWKGPGDTVEKGEKLASLEQQHLESQKALLIETRDSTQENLDLLQADASTSPNLRDVAILKEELKTLENQLEQLDSQLETGTIFAPYQGTIATQMVQEGETVPVGRPVFKLIENAPPRVELQIPQKLAHDLSVGKQVWLQKGDKQIKAVVSIIAPEIDQSSRTRSVTLEVDNAESWQSLELGEVVEVWFWVPSDKRGVWLPYSALQQQGNGTWSVFVIESGDQQQRVERRIVSIQQLEGDQVLVQGSLQAGDLVIFEGIHRVVRGQYVQANEVERDFSPSPHPGAIE